MLIEELRERLVPLPERLPPPPKALIPTLLADLGGLPGRLPEARVVRDGAALVLLFPGAGREAHVLLTERPAGDLRHAGEISFPGGALEPSDSDHAAAALREAAEEVALDPEQAGVTIVGGLEPVEIRVSGFRLVPLLAFAERAPRLTPHAREVAAILEVPFDQFVPPAPIAVQELERDGRRLRYGAYLVGGHAVWGATALVLGQLGALVAGTASEGGRGA
jgi:8-oxo-dGTP pyrophosphatase MutT (NUDIX family)